MRAFLQWFRRQPGFVIQAECLVMVLLVGELDYITGIDVVMTEFYYAPIALGAWFVGRRAGIWLACCSTLMWLLANVLVRLIAGHSFVSLWNAVGLGVEFCIVAYLVDKIARNTQTLAQTVARRSEELRHAQMQLAETAKAEVVGRLAAGIAHEVKNPLMTLSLGADYFLARPSANPDERMLVQDMKEAVHRASKIINLLLTVSRPAPLQETEEEINTLIENALLLVRQPLAKGRVTVMRELQHDLPPVLLDRTRVEHALINILLNAIQAMPESGTLTIRTSLRTDTDNGPAQLVVEVSDTGAGIKQEHLGRLYEPFFTTKAPGQGTGLGLSIVRKIMALHQGSIQIANRPEGGVTVTLRFNTKTKGTT